MKTRLNGSFQASNRRIPVSNAVKCSMALLLISVGIYVVSYVIFRAKAAISDTIKEAATIGIPRFLHIAKNLTLRLRVGKRFGSRLLGGPFLRWCWSIKLQSIAHILMSNDNCCFVNDTTRQGCRGLRNYPLLDIPSRSSDRSRQRNCVGLLRMNRRQSGRGQPHSKTLTRDSDAL